MVTEAGKELLRNTINTANFHNKLLEQNEMWKQWEIERGLTMMVTDDDVLKRIRKNHQCAKHRRRERSRERRTDDLISSVPSGSKSDAARWDHSGFQELYPDVELTERRLPEKWDHSGFLELYPDADVTKKKSSNSKEHSKKHKKKKKKRHVELSNSDSEIYEEFKKFKSQSKKDKIKLSKRRSSGYDSHVKEWKKHKNKLM